MELITIMISNIIHSRNNNNIKRDKTNNKIGQSTLRLSSLPCDIIRECASHLYFCEYQSFQKVSRYIYLGCHSPVPLKQFDTTILNKLHIWVN